MQINAFCIKIGLFLTTWESVVGQAYIMHGFKRWKSRWWHQTVQSPNRSKIKQADCTNMTHLSGIFILFLICKCKMFPFGKMHSIIYIQLPVSSKCIHCMNHFTQILFSLLLLIWLQKKNKQIGERFWVQHNPSIYLFSLFCP